MKKSISLFLTVLMALSVVAVAGTASAVETATVNDKVCKVGGTVTYTYKLTTPGKAEDFQGELDYSSGLALEDFVLNETNGLVTYNTKIEGAVYYTGSSPEETGKSYDYTGGVTLITAKFRVKEAGVQAVENKMYIVTGIDGTQYYDFGKNISCEESETITVDTYAVESLSLDKNSLAVYTGKTAQLKATVNPEYATNADLKWTSSDESVVTVEANDTDATLTAVRPGTSTITVSCGTFSAKCDVTVADEIINVSSLTLSPAAATVKVTKTQKLTATIAPANATVKDVEWSTSNKNVATVTSAGVVKGVSKGTATITAKAKDGSGVKATAKITVTQPVTSLSVAKSLTVNVKAKKTLKATIKPTNANNKSLTWTSSNAKVAKVSAKGIVTGLRKGSATITVKTKDGSNKTAKCKVTVIQPVNKVTLPKKATVKVKGKLNLAKKVKVTPTNANNKTLKWASKKTKIAKVSSKGVVTGVKKGSAVITATTKDGSKKSAKCTVTVKK